jgi:hypothetical protein
MADDTPRNATRLPRVSIAVAIVARWLAKGLYAYA